MLKKLLTAALALWGLAPVSTIMASDARFSGTGAFVPNKSQANARFSLSAELIPHTAVAGERFVLQAQLQANRAGTPLCFLPDSIFFDGFE